MVQNHPYKIYKGVFCGLDRSVEHIFSQVLMFPLAFRNLNIISSYNSVSKKSDEIVDVAPLNHHSWLLTVIT